MLLLKKLISAILHAVPDAEPGPVRFGRFHRDLDFTKLNQPGIAACLEEVHGHNYRAPGAMGRRTLRQLLEEKGALSSDHAIRIFLATCKLMRRVYGVENKCRSTSAEHILVDSHGAIDIINRVTGRPSDHEGTEVLALGGLLYEMLTGKPPSNRTTREELGSLAPSGLREIVDRALGRDPKNPYATAKDLVRDVKREERARFCKTKLIPIVLFGFTVLLYVYVVTLCENQLVVR